MSDHLHPEALIAIPLPDEAILVTDLMPIEGEDEERHRRRLAITALQRSIAERRLTLTLGPTLDPQEPDRLLSLNRVAIQLVITGLTSDQVLIPTTAWQQQATAPQLVLAVALDDELGVVQALGVLTAPELIAAARGASAGDMIADDMIALPVESFRGGLQRLFSLALLASPDILPRCALEPTARMATLSRVLDWCLGELSAALEELGASLEPVSVAAFRQASTTHEEPPPGALAIVALPLGLATNGELRTGMEAKRCIERFQLLLIPVAVSQVAPGNSSQPTQLLLQLQGDPAGDLMPDGVELTVFQGGRRQSLTTATSTQLELQLPADEALIEITITPPSAPALQLPPLQLLPA